MKKTEGGVAGDHVASSSAHSSPSTSFKNKKNSTHCKTTKHPTTKSTKRIRANITFDYKLTCIRYLELHGEAATLNNFKSITHVTQLRRWMNAKSDLIRQVSKKKGKALSLHPGRHGAAFDEEEKELFRWRICSHSSLERLGVRHSP